MDSSHRKSSAFQLGPRRECLVSTHCFIKDLFLTVFSLPQFFQMKFVAALALLASATAFAPQPVSTRVSTKVFGDYGKYDDAVSYPIVRKKS